MVGKQSGFDVQKYTKERGDSSVEGGQAPQNSPFPITAHPAKFEPAFLVAPQTNSIVCLEKINK